MQNLKQSEQIMPKYKKELRAAIFKNVKSIKNTYALKDLYRISDILSRQWDNEKYMTLTKEEWDKSSLLRAIMGTEDSRKISNLSSFAQALLYNEPGRKERIK